MTKQTFVPFFVMVLLALYSTALCAGKKPLASPSTTVLIDVSSSMEEAMGDKTRLNITSTGLISQLQLGSHYRISGIHVYSNQGKKDCAQTRRLAEYNSDDLDAFEKKMLALKPLGTQSVAAILKHYIKERGSRSDTNRILFIAGNSNVCLVNVCRDIKAIEAQGYPLRIDVLGLNQSDESRKLFQCIAKQTNGVYLNVQNEAEYNKAVEHLLTRTQPTVTDKVKAITLRFPARTNTSASVKVDWKGPANKFDRIVVSSLNSKDEYAYAYVEPGSSHVQLTMPKKPGQYRINYVTGLEQKTLGSQLVRVDAVKASLKAPTTVNAGSHFDLMYTGPDNEYDQIRIVDPKNPKQSGSYTFTKLSKDFKATLTAPEKPGHYEIRYVTRSNRVLTRTTLAVKKPNVTLKADNKVVAGSAFNVYWEGPKNQYDQIRLVKLDESLSKTASPGSASKRVALAAKPAAKQDDVSAGKKSSMVAAKNAVSSTSDDAGGAGKKSTGDTDKLTVGSGPAVLSQSSTVGADQKSTLQAPEQAGRYMIQYVSARRTVLASKPIEVIKASASFKPVNPVAAGSQMRVSWYGPNNEYDQIVLVDPKRPDKVLAFTYAKINRMKWAYMEVPEKPGDYQLLYKTEANRILASQAVKVHPVNAEINPITQPVKAGTNFEVSWKGPMNQYDQLQIVSSENAKKPLTYIFVNRYRNYRTRLVAPKKAGTYQIVYLTSKKKVLAHTTLVVR